MTIAYYISGHGFGHFVRSAAVIKALPAEIPLVVRTSIPEWFLKQELAGRTYSSFPASFDCGVLGFDSSMVDIDRTFEAAERLIQDNSERLRGEIEFLQSHRVRIVVSDMPSFPLMAAKLAGIPSICETNFTWVEIYEHLASMARARGERELAARGDGLAAELRAEYAAGDLLLIPGMALEMGACARQVDIPLIARTGRARRTLLCERLGMDPRVPIHLLYLGQDGYAGMEWETLKSIPDAQFFSFRPIEEAGDAVHVLPKDLMDHSDATATADAVVGKLGYSLCAECAATGRPLIFPPRPDFIESEALGRSMVEFGLGVPMASREFQRLDWRGALTEAAALKVNARPIDCSGAQICAEIINMAWREGSLEGIMGPL